MHQSVGDPGYSECLFSRNSAPPSPGPAPQPLASGLRGWAVAGPSLVQAASPECPRPLQSVRTSFTPETGWGPQVGTSNLVMQRPPFSEEVGQRPQLEGPVPLPSRLPDTSIWELIGIQDLNNTSMSPLCLFLKNYIGLNLKT